jgi:septation ring formation regulator EzrA
LLSASAALATATEKVNLTQAAYSSAQENYTKMAQNAAKIDAELVRIKSSLKSLEAENITMVRGYILIHSFTYFYINAISG